MTLTGFYLFDGFYWLLLKFSCFQHRSFKTEQINQRLKITIVKLNGLQACNFIYKKTTAQMFSKKFCYIFKNCFFLQNISRAASFASVKNYQKRNQASANSRKNIESNSHLSCEIPAKNKVFTKPIFLETLC